VVVALVTVAPMMFVVPAVMVAIVKALARLDDATGRQQRAGNHGESRE